jgi:hypothetical protein
MLKLSALGLVLLLFVAEIGVRVQGYANYPLYRLDPGAGYVPAPGSGRFGGRARWFFNADGMGTDKPYRRGSVLLIGDSVVAGNIALDQSQHVAAFLERLTGHPIYPVAAPDWALLNELGYLQGRAATTKSAACVIFVTNSGDFVAKAQAARFLLPTRHHVLETIYLLERGPLRKYLIPRGVTTEADWRSPLKALPAKPRFVLYSQKIESPSVMELWARKIAAVRPDATFTFVHLPANMFADDIHPTVAGGSELAAKIAPIVRGCPAARNS